MDTRELEAQTMKAARHEFLSKNHASVGWESFLGGAVRILECTICHRFALVSVLPNGSTDEPTFHPEKDHDWGESGIQVYETDIRGSAPTTECGERKVS